MNKCATCRKRFNGHENDTVCPPCRLSLRKRKHVRMAPRCLVDDAGRVVTHCDHCGQGDIAVALPWLTPRPPSLDLRAMIVPGGKRQWWCWRCRQFDKTGAREVQ